VCTKDYDGNDDDVLGADADVATNWLSINKNIFIEISQSTSICIVFEY